MLRELAELREDARALAARLAEVQARRFAGLPFALSFRELVRTHRLATSSDGLAQAREALANALEEDPPRPGRITRLTGLCRFLEHARAMALEPGAAQEVFELPQRKLVRPPGDAGLHGALPFIAVERELPLIRSRDKRAGMEAALSEAVQQGDPVRSAAFEAAQAVRGGQTGGAAFAEQVLDETDALANDLGAWLLERHTGARRSPGGAERHDVLHLMWAPRCASAFPRGELLRTLRRWAGMLRLNLDTQVKLDEEDRPLKWPGAHAVAVDPPYEVALSVLPEEGPRTLSLLLGAAGVALLESGPASDAPPEDLWFGDPVVAHACAALFESLVCEPEFLRRCAKADLSRDDERAISIASVLDARIAAARWLATNQAFESGFGARTASAHRDLYARAAGADLPAGLALSDLDPFGAARDELRGRMLAARMRASLRERFDEDFWRNPRTLGSLNSLFARGGRATVKELWAELGAEEGTQPLSSALAEACQ